MMSAGGRAGRHGARGLLGVVTMIAALLGAQMAHAALLSRKPAPAAAKPAAKPSNNAPADIWVATWEAAPTLATSPTVLTRQTVRQIARVSVGGIYVRVRLSNEFGDRPLVIGSAHIALAVGAGAAIQPGTDRPLTFGGKPQIVIPPGARALSDPASLTVPALSSVAVSLYFPEAVGAVTEHAFAMQTSYLAPNDVTAAADLPGATTMNSQVILTGVDMSAGASSRVVVALGDSLTAGFGSTPDTNHRWPDRLAERLIARTGKPPLSVVNAGVAGNRLLHDFFGPNALSRFDRDVLSQPNVGYLVVLLGINDFGLPGGRHLPAEEVTPDDVIAGYRQLIVRAHSYGIKVFIGTMPPFGPIPQRPGFYSDASEFKRQTVNNWIRTNKEFEGFIDFEAALRDPKTSPARLLPQYDSGDHLSPNDAGYKAMADAVEMRLFEN